MMKSKFYTFLLVLVLSGCVQHGNYYSSKSIVPSEDIKGYWVSVLENLVVGDSIVFLSLNDKGQMLTCSTGSVGTKIGKEYKLIKHQGSYAAISTSGTIHIIKNENNKMELEGWLTFEKTDQITAKCKKLFNDMDF